MQSIRFPLEVLVVVLLIDELGYTGKLNIRRALINGACEMSTKQSIRIKSLQKKNKICYVTPPPPPPAQRTNLQLSLSWLRRVRGWGEWGCYASHCQSSSWRTAEPTWKWWEFQWHVALAVSLAPCLYNDTLRGGIPTESDYSHCLTLVQSQAATPDPPAALVICVLSTLWL